MVTLLKNGKIIDVFLGEVVEKDILIKNDIIIGVGDYKDYNADEVIDLQGKYVCPGFIDGHIHIESTMMIPSNLASVSLVHGTTSIICDPHEIANVCGIKGIKFMLEESKDIPMDVYFMLPSCVPATMFDESFEELDNKKLIDLYNEKRVLGLAEMMNFVGVCNEDKLVLDKINDAKKLNKIIDGHAPMLSGHNLDKYISYGINSDHECSTLKEALERISKGQWLMIREGTAARNLEALSPLFDMPCKNRCLLVTDDKSPADLLNVGHIDSIIRKAVKLGKSVITAIQMATIQAAQCFRLEHVGAICPSYKADLVVLNDLENLDIIKVYKNGKLIVDDRKLLSNIIPNIDGTLLEEVCNTMNVKDINTKDLYVLPKSNKCHVIEILPGELITNDLVIDMDFNINNGINLSKDILKLCVIERHKNTNHIGHGYIKGLGLKEGAIASSVSHDSHNLIVIGTNDDDMALACNTIKKMGGGNCFVRNGIVEASFALPVAGLMTTKSAEEISIEVNKVRQIVYKYGVYENIAPFMNMAFVSLPVIPSLKLTTLGLVDVMNFKLVDLFIKD